MLTVAEETLIELAQKHGKQVTTVERPLRLAVDLSAEHRKRFRAVCKDANEEPLGNVVDRVAKSLGAGPHRDFNTFMVAIDRNAQKHGVKLNAKRRKLLQTELARRDEDAEPVVKKVHKGGKVAVDPIRGFYASPVGNKRTVVEYEPDSELRDTEQVQLLEQGGIEAFLRREVLPHAADAWYDENSVKIGYEIRFNRYFYKPQPLRTLEEIRSNILAVKE